MDALLAATSTGLVRAESSGGAWRVERVIGADVRCLAAEAGRAGVAWAGMRDGGLWRSGDAGRTWRRAGLDGLTITSVAATPGLPGVVYAGTRPPRIHVTRDDGASWSELEGFRRIRSRRLWFSPAERPFTAYVQGLAVSPSDPDRLLAGIEFGAVVSSADAGRTWSGHRRRASRDCHSLVFHPTDGRFAYEGGGTGPASSRDGGESWDADRTGLDRRYCWAAAGDPDEPETWFVSAATGPRAAHGGANAEACVFRRAPTGWERILGPLDDMPYGLFHDADLLHAGLSSGRVLRLGADGWTALPLELGAGCRVFAPVR